MEEKETQYDIIYVLRSLNAMNEYSVCDIRAFVITFMSSGAQHHHHQQQQLNRSRAFARFGHIQIKVSVLALNSAWFGKHVYRILLLLVLLMVY